MIGLKALCPPEIMLELFEAIHVTAPSPSITTVSDRVLEALEANEQVSLHVNIGKLQELPADLLHAIIFLKLDSKNSLTKLFISQTPGYTPTLMELLVAARALSHIVGVFNPIMVELLIKKLVDEVEKVVTESTPWQAVQDTLQLFFVGIGTTYASLPMLKAAQSSDIRVDISDTSNVLRLINARLDNKEFLTYFFKKKTIYERKAAKKLREDTDAVKARLDAFEAEKIKPAPPVYHQQPSFGNRFSNNQQQFGNRSSNSGGSYQFGNGSAAASSRLPNPARGFDQRAAHGDNMQHMCNKFVQRKGCDGRCSSGGFKLGHACR